MNVQKQPTAIASAEYVRVVHGHVTPQGVDWREALSPDYWEHVANRLRPVTGSKFTASTESRSDYRFGDR